MSKNKAIHISMDDVDTPDYGCTTYALSLIIKELKTEQIKFLDYPHLIRLNPNIPWKTRGNGAVSLVLEHEDPDHIFKVAKKILYINYVKAGKKSTPAIVLFNGNSFNDELLEFSKEALYRVMSVKRAKQLLVKYNFIYSTYGGEIGLVGALAGLCNHLTEHTYELICYRKEENFAKPRKVYKESVIRMSAKTYPFTYNNYDPVTDRVMITPHGPDPILFGIRGLTPKKLLAAFKMLKIEEQVSHYVIFKTNQGTNSHFVKFFKIKDIKPYYSVKVKGKVKTVPNIEVGGHVFFLLEDDTSSIKCAAYEPTKIFRSSILKLRPGDEVEIGGGIRAPNKKDSITLNIEYLKILNLSEDCIYENPLCPLCNKHMKSLGKNKGFECDKCKFKLAKASKVKKIISRDVKLGLYIPPPSAHRHLTKPLQYYSTGLTVNAPFVNNMFLKVFE